MKKVAFVTGISGQDGSYLAELLLSKGYAVHGLLRRSSSPNTQRIEHLVQGNSDLKLHEGDLTDSSNLAGIISAIKPDEIYNLGAQSHVGTSFDSPEYTANVDALGALRLLECIRHTGLKDTCRYYQASTSELFGRVYETPQTEKTPFYPRSPYGVAKLYAYWITLNYRESYGIYACNGILFNHESPRRGQEFVTRKITTGLAKVILGAEERLVLGNLDALRDWGHAVDYVQMQWLMLQQNTPKDYVIATGRQYSVREFIKRACNVLGITIEFTGKGLQEVGVITGISNKNLKNLQVGAEIVRVSPKYFRPAEVDTLLGDSTLAAHELGWRSKISFDELVEEMMISDIRSTSAACGVSPPI